MSDTSVGFGFCLPTFTATRQGLFRVPNWRRLDAGEALKAAVAAERDGFDTLWVPDHYMIGDDEAVLDGWTTLAAAAGATHTIRLNLIQHSMLFRRAPQFAKMAATLDQLSCGRLTVFSSFGRNEPEHRAYGFDWFDDPAERLARFAEGLDVVRRMWTEEEPISHRGRYFTLDEAVCEPKPAQPHLPLWFAGSEPEIYQLTAEVGDGWNTHPVSLDAFKHCRNELAGVCRSANRDMGQLTVSYEAQILIRETIPEIRDFLRQLPGAGLFGDLADQEVEDFVAGRTNDLPQQLTDACLIGTPEVVHEQIDAFVRAGANHFGLWFLDFPDRTGIELFSGKVATAFGKS